MLEQEEFELAQIKDEITDRIVKLGDKEVNLSATQIKQLEVELQELESLYKKKLNELEQKKELFLVSSRLKTLNENFIFIQHLKNKITFPFYFKTKNFQSFIKGLPIIEQIFTERITALNKCDWKEIETRHFEMVNLFEQVSSNTDFSLKRKDIESYKNFLEKMGSLKDDLYFKLENILKEKEGEIINFNKEIFESLFEMANDKYTEAYQISEGFAQQINVENQMTLTLEDYEKICNELTNKIKNLEEKKKEWVGNVEKITKNELKNLDEQEKKYRKQLNSEKNSFQKWILNRKLEELKSEIEFLSVPRKQYNILSQNKKNLEREKEELKNKLQSIEKEMKKINKKIPDELKCFLDASIEGIKKYLYDIEQEIKKIEQKIEKEFLIPGEETGWSVNLCVSEYKDEGRKTKKTKLEIEQEKQKRLKNLQSILKERKKAMDIPINSFGDTLFTSAIEFNSTEDRIKVLEILIEAGFDINQKNWMGMTPLILAIRANDLELVKFLKQRGAKLDIPSSHCSFYFIQGSGRRIFSAGKIPVEYARAASPNLVPYLEDSNTFIYEICQYIKEEKDKSNFDAGMQLIQCLETKDFSNLNYLHKVFQMGVLGDIFKRILNCQDLELQSIILLGNLEYYMAQLKKENKDKSKFFTNDSKIKATEALLKAVSPEEVKKVYSAAVSGGRLGDLFERISIYHKKFQDSEMKIELKIKK